MCKNSTLKIITQPPWHIQKMTWKRTQFPLHSETLISGTERIWNWNRQTSIWLLCPMGCSWNLEGLVHIFFLDTGSQKVPQQKLKNPITVSLNYVPFPHSKSSFWIWCNKLHYNFLQTALSSEGPSVCPYTRMISACRNGHSFCQCCTPVKVRVRLKIASSTEYRSIFLLSQLFSRRKQMLLILRRQINPYWNTPLHTGIVNFFWLKYLILI